MIGFIVCYGKFDFEDVHTSGMIVDGKIAACFITNESDS